MKIVAYVVRVYINDELHSTYRVDSEADAWDMITKLRAKLECYGQKLDFTSTEVLRYGDE